MAAKARRIALVAIVALGCEQTEVTARFERGTEAIGGAAGTRLVQVDSGGWGFESPAATRRGTAPATVDPRQQCRGIPEAQRESCPSEVIGRWVRSVTNVDRGVLLRLSTSAGTAGQTAVRFRCHHAMTRRTPAHACPLNIGGLQIGVSRLGDELRVRLTTADDSELDLLRSRARALLVRIPTS
ncbi:MAG: hypothetical protein HYY06_27285 [Deltaproteobacteria bacterium]|nr:hypothetical protein [Deltaproteobacteria bacterium]